MPPNKKVVNPVESKEEGFTFPKIQKTNLKMAKQRILYQPFVAQKVIGEKYFSFKDVDALVRLQMERIKRFHPDKKIRMEVQLAYDPETRKGSHIFRSGGFFDIDEEDPRYFEYAEDESAQNFYIPNPYQYQRFDIFYSVEPKYKPEGGCREGKEEFNDCLYFALKCFNVVEEWNNPSDLKRFLKLQRKDKVPVSKMEAIEKKLNCRINVVGKGYSNGEGDYFSNYKSSREINLILSKEHYFVNKSKRRQLKGIAFEPKQLIAVNYVGGDRKYAYDGEPLEITDEEYKQAKQKPISSPYMFIRMFDDYKYGLEEFSKEILEVNKVLVDESNGVIDFRKTGGIKKTCINLYDYFNKTILFEPLTKMEQVFIAEASRGAIIFGKIGEYEKAYRYDVVSFYPSMMKDNNIRVPFKQGEFKKLQKAGVYNTYGGCFYGIYIAKVKFDESKKRLFRYADEKPVKGYIRGYYTHIDIQEADRLGLDWDIDNDIGVNALIYTWDKLITSHQMFSRLIEFLFPLKVKYSTIKSTEVKAKRIEELLKKTTKSLLNTIWGGLSESKKRTLIHNDEEPDETDTIEEDEELTSMNGFPEKTDSEKITTFSLKIKDLKNLFEYPEARLKPFLLARGRQKINAITAPFIDDVVYCHTDGFVSTRLLSELKTGENIGEVKYEGYYNNLVMNSNILSKKNNILHKVN